MPLPNGILYHPPLPSLLAAELAAVDLTSGALLWRRRVPTHGLLNIVAAPQLGEASTYRAIAHDPRVTKSSATTTISDDGASSKGGSSTTSGSGSGDDSSSSTTGRKAGVTSVTDSLVLGGIDDPRVRAATARLEALGYTPRSGGKWASGQPYLDLGVKDGPRGWEAGISLPLMQLNIDKLRVREGGGWAGAGTIPHPATSHSLAVSTRRRTTSWSIRTETRAMAILLHLRDALCATPCVC